MAPHTHIPAPRNTIETYSARPEREPPRNENNEIICTHEQCRDKNEIFRRPCEWNKHMDKHERPYKCSEATCEQNPGFTYSGGLLRHMREVHKKGVGPARRPLYCPHSNCIRSTGEGFTRRENLEEHLRRRHSYTGHYSPPPQSTSDNNEDGQEPSKKRRKTTDPESPNGITQQNQLSQSLQDSRTAALRAELANIDEHSFMNGDLDQAEANRQLAIARQTIASQQELIRQLDTELNDLRANLHSLGGAAYSRASERSPMLATGVIPLPAHLPQDQYPTDPQVSQINGNAQIDPPTDPRLMQDPQIQDAQDPTKSDVDMDRNGSEPSRRIEIARDLVGEKEGQQEQS